MKNLIDNKINELTNKVAAATESALMEQLNDLVARGLLVVEQGELTMVEEFSPEKNGLSLSVKKSVRLVLKDKEYIEQLENENTDLRHTVSQLNSEIEGFRNKLKFLVAEADIWSHRIRGME